MKRLLSVLAVAVVAGTMVLGSAVFAEGKENKGKPEKAASKVVKGTVQVTKDGDKVTAVSVKGDDGSTIEVPEAKFAKFQALDGKTIDVVCVEKDGKLVAEGIKGGGPKKEKAPGDKPEKKKTP